MTDVTRLLDRYRPDFVLVGSPARHPSGTPYVYHAAVSALRRSSASLAAYCGNSTTLDFSPTVFVDIASVVETKMQALSKHESQNSKGY
jgi:LmbE family N-acetylglucosaminyl deacetylase